MIARPAWLPRDTWYPGSTPVIFGPPRPLPGPPGSYLARPGPALKKTCFTTNLARVELGVQKIIFEKSFFIHLRSVPVYPHINFFSNRNGGTLGFARPNACRYPSWTSLDQFGLFWTLFDPCGMVYHPKPSRTDGVHRRLLTPFAPFGTLP